MLKGRLLNAILLMFVCSVSCQNKRDQSPRVLLFSKTDGFYHASIPSGISAIMGLGKENGFEVDTTTSSHFFCADTLEKYAAVVFLNTTGNVLDYKEELAFEQYIQSGGGFVGIHAASDTEFDWRWYGGLVGAYFDDHPKPQNATLYVQDTSHISTRGLPSVFEYHDEWYNFKDINPDINVLITIDESTYEGGKNGLGHPISWYHEYDGGRSFYTALGHSEDSFEDSFHLNHILGGIKYATGMCSN